MSKDEQRLQLQFVRLTRLLNKKSQHRDKVFEIKELGVRVCDILSVSCNLTDSLGEEVISNVNIKSGICLPTRMPLREIARLLKNALPEDSEKPFKIHVTSPAKRDRFGNVVGAGDTSGYTLDEYCRTYGVR